MTEQAEEQEVYKVVYEYPSGRLESTVYNPWTRITYRQDEWVTCQNNRKLLAFKEKNDAIRFNTRAIGSEVIYRCVATGVEKIDRLLRPSTIDCEEILDVFWGRNEEDLDALNNGLHLIVSPCGTVACDKIKLLERINIDD